jgi:hypothetical protein
MRNTAGVTGGLIAVSISGGDAIGPLVAFTTSMEEKERCYYFILSRTPHEIIIVIIIEKSVMFKTMF